ncbi:MAG: M14 family metallopeptidase [Bacteroidales bacterium]|nr:M14 family metallopeptidase [Bacteroidales bacterium]
MKQLFTLCCLFGLACVGLQAQTWPEDNPGFKFYTVSGFRHGVSFFPKVQYPQVEYIPSSTLTFDKYHAANVVYFWMKKWAEQYPNLVEFYEVAKSYEGRPIYQMTLTNKSAGKATDKPAAYFEGGRHSGEISSTESVLWLMQYLIEQYGKDPEVTKILDKNAIHLRPINNPDGHNLYLYTAQSNRSTVRPHDNDGDGLLDEDGPEDLDGDGYILQMRWKDTINGNFIIDPRDPSGRLMLRVEPGKGNYSMNSEGIDNDGDGLINEDGIGGLDLHRNYAENWRPMQEFTGRGWIQGGAGEFPLSETETRSVVLFLLSNPNIYVVNSMDTAVPMHLRAPSTAPASAMFPEDNKWYTLFDNIGKGITGYERAGDVYQDYGGGNPLFGHGPDFGYWYYGAIWYGDEIWNSGRATKDYNNDGVIDDLDRLIMNDEEYGGTLFTNWKPYPNHPDLGYVEIGGWNPKFFLQNPPADQMERWVKNQALFNIEMVKHLPELQWGDIEVRKARTYRQDSTDYQIKVSYRNVGKLPTALRQADLVKIVRPDQVKISLPRTAVEGAHPQARILPDPNAPPPRQQRAGTPANPRETTRSAGYAQGESVNSVTITVRVYGNHEIQATASVSTTRAGILSEKAFVIK